MVHACLLRVLVRVKIANVLTGEYIEMCEVSRMPSGFLESESTMTVRAELFQPTWIPTFASFMKKRELHVINCLDSTHGGLKTVKKRIFC